MQAKEEEDKEDVDTEAVNSVESKLQRSGKNSQIKKEMTSFNELPVSPGMESIKSPPDRPNKLNRSYYPACLAESGVVHLSTKVDTTLNLRPGL